ncbi:MAG: long-chain fatty acid--CoA ligase [Ignavibacteriae bacterium]|nr:long-chain fatty acid--CoA ligase [Ignavibacteriota bacterium]
MIHSNWFERWSRYSPDAIALKDDATGRSFSYQESYRLINRFARVLQNEFGIQAGDRVAALAMNEVEYVFLFFAIQRINAILVPVNFRLVPREIEHIVRDCSPKLLIYQQQFGETIRKMAPESLPLRRLCFDGPDSFVSRLYCDSLPGDPIPLENDLEAACMILYTSGTTGNVKGAIITNKMIFWNSVNTTMRLNLTQTDVSLIFAPFFHTGGWNVLTTPLLHRGARLINLKKFDADNVLRLCDSEGVTILFGVPTMMDMLYRSPVFNEVSLKTVRYAIVGGEPMPLELIKAWQNKGVPIRQGYGLTEFGPNVYSLNEQDAIRKIGSIGFPNFYIDAKIVDEHDNELGDEQVGELALHGPVCTPGYWNNPTATSEAIKDGWFHTGDLVRGDNEGYYYVVDRKKDMFISGAENVYPAEIEHVLRSHSAIREAAVVGVPDAKWREVGKAFVVVKTGMTLTADDVIAFCSSNLAKYKTPKHVEFLDELPKSDSGKILKRALKGRA